MQDLQDFILFIAHNDTDVRETLFIIGVFVTLWLSLISSAIRSIFSDIVTINY